VTGPDQWDRKTLRVDKWTTDPKRIVPEGCVFITVKGAGVGTIFPGVHSAIGRDVYAFQPAREIDSGFVRRALEFTISEIKHHAAGDIPGLSKQHILDHPIGLPPGEEQSRIVAKIDELLKHVNASCEHLAKVPKILKAFRQSVLSAGCSGRLTEDWRSRNSQRTAEDLIEEIARQRKRAFQVGGTPRYKEPFKPDSVLIEDVPEQWTVVSVE
jgi:type I restriction enzyme S subunit